jgi:hypothetical protein
MVEGEENVEKEKDRRVVFCSVDRKVRLCADTPIFRPSPWVTHEQLICASDALDGISSRRNHGTSHRLRLPTEGV